LLNTGQTTIVDVCWILIVFWYYGVYRILPDSIGLDKVAAKLKELHIHGLLLVGGFEVSYFYMLACPHPDSIALHIILFYLVA